MKMMIKLKCYGMAKQSVKYNFLYTIFANLSKKYLKTYEIPQYSIIQKPY